MGLRGFLVVASSGPPHRSLGDSCPPDIARRYALGAWARCVFLGCNIPGLFAGSAVLIVADPDCNPRATGRLLLSAWATNRAGCLWHELATLQPTIDLACIPSEQRRHMLKRVLGPWESFASPSALGVAITRPEP